MFYGWRVVAGAFITQMFVVGFFSYAVSLLTPALQAEFGASLEQVMYGMTLGTLAGLVFAPLAGALIDRLPVRLLMACGTLIFAGGLLLMSMAQSITQYVVLFGLVMALSNCLAAAQPAMAVVSRWFTANRGRALGVAAIGTSVGGALVPAALACWLGVAGWRGALQYLGLSALLVMLPAAVLLVRGWPKDVGMQPEHDPVAPPDVDRSPAAARDIVLDRNFWSLGLSMGLTMAAYSATLSNLTPYALAAGHDEGHGSALIMAVAVTGLIGKLLFGTGADRFNLKLGLWGAQLLAFAAYLLFATQPHFAFMLAAAACMGLAAGGLLPVWGAMLARIFGLHSYGTAMGLMTPLVTLCVVPAFLVVGRLVDSYGSFRSPMLVLAGTTLVAMVKWFNGCDQPS